MWLFTGSNPCLISGVDIGLLSRLWWVDLLVGMTPAARLGGGGCVISCRIATNHHWPTQCHTSSTFLQWGQCLVLSILKFLQLLLLLLLLFSFSVWYETHGSEKLGELVVKVANDGCNNDTFICQSDELIPVLKLTNCIQRFHNMIWWYWHFSDQLWEAVCLQMLSI